MSVIDIHPETPPFVSILLNRAISCLTNTHIIVCVLILGSCIGFIWISINKPNKAEKMVEFLGDTIWMLKSLLRKIFRF